MYINRIKLHNWKNFKEVDIPLTERVFECEQCHVVCGRDLNASLNLASLAVSSTVSACGEEGSGRARKSVVKPASVKQEASSRFSDI